MKGNPMFTYKVQTTNDHDFRERCEKMVARKQPLVLGAMFDLGSHIHPRRVLIEAIYHDGSSDDGTEQDVVVLKNVPGHIFKLLTEGKYGWILC